MTNRTQTTTVPSRRDVDAWRLEAETAIKFGGVQRLGQFDWPWVVLSLIAEWEVLAAMRIDVEVRRRLNLPTYDAPHETGGCNIPPRPIRESK